MNTLLGKLILNKYIRTIALLFLGFAFAGSPVLASTPNETQIKTELQKKLGSSANVKSVSASPVPGLYEVQVGGDVFYTDTNGKYLIQGDIIDLSSGKNITEQRQADLNQIRWADLQQTNSIKVVHGNGARQIAVFADPNCGYCKRLEKSLQELDNVTIYTYLIPILSADSATKAKQIWCSADPAQTWTNWMLNGSNPSGKGDCSTPIDKNMAQAKTYGVTGTPTLFFTDGSRFPGAAKLSDIEKKLSSLK